MADTAVAASATAMGKLGGSITSGAGGRAYAVAQVNHRVVARAFPEI